MDIKTTILALLLVIEVAYCTTNNDCTAENHLNATCGTNKICTATCIAATCSPDCNTGENCGLTCSVSAATEPCSAVNASCGTGGKCAADCATTHVKATGSSPCKTICTPDQFCAFQCKVNSTTPTIHRVNSTTTTIHPETTRNKSGKDSCSLQLMLLGFSILLLCHKQNI